MKVKRILYFISIFVMFYVIYVGFYQWIMNKGNALYDDRCIHINPLIIGRKKTYIESMRSLLVDYDTESYYKYTDEYLNFSLAYIDGEKEWLEDNFEFLNRWYVKYIVDKNTQDTLWLDHKMYEVELAESIIMIDLFNDLNEKNGQNQEKLRLKLMKNYDEYQDLEKQKDKLNKNAKVIFKNNIRSRLLRFPLSKCPAENNDIPNVEKELNKFIKSSEFETSPLPGIIG